MKKEYSILVNSSGEILERNYPVGIDETLIGDILPIYSYLHPFIELKDFLIEGYEFEYNKVKYYADLISNYSGSKFTIKIINRTDHYIKLAKEQTAKNQSLINEEYIKLSQKLLAEKNNYKQFILTRIEDVVKSSLAKIESLTNDLSQLTTFLQSDSDLLELVSTDISNQLNFLRKATVDASLLTKFDIELLFKDPISINLKSIIDKYDSKLHDSVEFHNNCDPNHLVYIGERGLDILLSYLLVKKVQDSPVAITVKSKKIANNATEINIEYVTSKPNDELPHKISHNLWLPSDSKSVENLSVIKQIINKLKQIYVEETSADLVIAA